MFYFSKIPKEFPNQAPTMFSKNAVDSDIVNRTTLEINYSKFYPWEKKTSKVVELLAASEKFFTANSPFDNHVSRKVDTMLGGIENQIIQNFERIDVNSFYNSLS